MKIFTVCIEQKGSLSCSQEPEPAKSVYTKLYFVMILVNIILRSTFGLPSAPFIQGVETKILSEIFISLTRTTFLVQFMLLALTIIMRIT